MIERPERQIEAFANAGAHGITIHAEATPHLHSALHADPRARTAAPGLPFNPGTPIARSRELEGSTTSRCA